MLDLFFTANDFLSCAQKNHRASSTALQSSWEQFYARTTPGSLFSSFRRRVTSRISNLNTKAANSIPLWLLAALELGLGARGLRLGSFCVFGSWCHHQWVHSASVEISIEPGVVLAQIRSPLHIALISQHWWTIFICSGGHCDRYSRRTNS